MGGIREKGLAQGFNICDSEKMAANSIGQISALRERKESFTQLEKSLSAYNIGKKTFMKI